MKTHYEVRYAAHPEDVKRFDTQQIRRHFLVTDIMKADEVRLVYSHYDRLIIGGACPAKEPLELSPIGPIRGGFFLERRELGIINVGGPGAVSADGQDFEIDFKEALYVGRGVKTVLFKSRDSSRPARFYLNSATAHAAYPVQKVTQKNAVIADLGSAESSNQRRIFKLLINDVIKTCQLQMGMTELKTGSVWNTMPPHVHDRRMEAYFYFEVPKGQPVCHFMGEPGETRHIWLGNEEAVISPDWSIHSAAGTSNYTFIWGMAGENLDFGDMDAVAADDLK
ncbi:MAG: 5-dehydro-4-deoxy-D-glucuronate isomerase [Vicinamibacteria bacterium]|nr:5-dehydro-4-deoxy-D-glucuronate isomerase [Vicinamibacteria bacterium]